MLRAQWQSYLDHHASQPNSADGVSYLPELGVLEFRGADVLSFLQGYLTCDTIDLPTDTLTAMAVCNIKGRVVVNGWCYRPTPAEESDAVILIIHASLAASVAQFFKPYMMFSKSTLNQLSDETVVFGAAGLAQGLAIDSRHTLILIDKLADAEAVWQQYPRLAADSWRLGLIGALIPLVSAATSESFLPQMLDLERLGAVHFDKGCYLGQEVVARAQHRGEVKRRLQRLRWAGPDMPEPGDQFGTSVDPERKLGTVVNAAPIADAAGECLAVLANDATGPYLLRGTELSRIG